MWVSWLKVAKTDKKMADFIKKYHHRPAEELYDLDKYPHEFNNLAVDPKQNKVLTTLRKNVEDWMKATNDQRAEGGKKSLEVRQLTLEDIKVKAKAKEQKKLKKKKSGKKKVKKDKKKEKKKKQKGEKKGDYWGEGLERKQNFFAMTMSMDRNIGRVPDALDKKTISDNGGTSFGRPIKLGMTKKGDNLRITLILENVLTYNIKQLIWELMNTELFNNEFPHRAFFQVPLCRLSSPGVF